MSSTGDGNRYAYAKGVIVGYSMLHGLSRPSGAKGKHIANCVGQWERTLLSGSTNSGLHNATLDAAFMLCEAF
jgi:hypothetical protein